MIDFDSLPGIALYILIWAYPILRVRLSDKTSGDERLGWMLAVALFSWVAFIFFLLVAPLKKVEE